MVTRIKILLWLLALTAGTGLSQAQARDYISIVGSSTVYPFATVAAEQFGRATKFKTPKVEATGSGGGLKLFCSGIGVEYPDMATRDMILATGMVDGMERSFERLDEIVG